MAVGAQPGNQNARKSRLFEQALIREIKQRDLKDGDGETMRKLASVVLQKGLDGDLAAAREVVDRLDGKPAQVIQGDAENPLYVQEIERRIVDPKA